MLVAGVVLGSGISGYAAAPGNDACLSVLSVDEAATVAESYSWAPFGTRCEVAIDGRSLDVERLGPGVTAWIAWIAAMAALVTVAVLRPTSSGVTGALSAAVLIALAGFAAHNGTDFSFTGFVVVVLGAPAAFLVQYLWPPRHRRSWPSAFLVTLLLAPTTFVVATAGNFTELGHPGAVVALLCAAGISTAAGRLG